MLQRGQRLVTRWSSFTWQIDVEQVKYELTPISLFAKNVAKLKNCVYTLLLSKPNLKLFRLLSLF